MDDFFHVPEEIQDLDKLPSLGNNGQGSQTIITELLVLRRAEFEIFLQLASRRGVRECLNGGVDEVLKFGVRQKNAATLFCIRRSSGCN